MKKFFLITISGILALAANAQGYREDVNGDGMINAADVVAVYNGIINGGNCELQDKYIRIGALYKMVAVKGGTFQMGATAEQQNPYDDEKPVHYVTLSDFYIGETEVTQALWKTVMGTNPSANVADDNLPVENLTWDDCQTFVAKLNELTSLKFRLPTEAEWEYAARGGQKSKGYQYCGGNTIDDIAWHKGNSDGTTHLVGTKAPNELGIYDMAGNVYEWCQDWYGPYSSEPQTNPTGPTSGTYRVLRGGGYAAATEKMRSSFRYYNSPDKWYPFFGLRLVLSE